MTAWGGGDRLVDGGTFIKSNVAITRETVATLHTLDAIVVFCWKAIFKKSITECHHDLIASGTADTALNGIGYLRIPRTSINSWNASMSMASVVSL